MIDLDLDDLLHIAHRVLPEVQVRDAGLLASAAARPATTVFGADAYASLHLRVAALAQSIARNHALVDGNKRLTLAAIIAAYGLNGRRLTLTNDEAYDLIIAISTGALDEVADIAAALEAGSESRG
ncbi:type II toxin-antitoxin system death-on-curing family toxin [Marihabitans asiaticum]|uniref:Death-on-curing protein n=1 Tax=Marihabitans asiaticum TaxID=415218 RepID=A0A560WGY6_9MICO|nr:Fic family protein [Marihabitans asiaticum]TWD16932.1 death-on-curing protein [Marihabitans asiaticum]